MNDNQEIELFLKSVYHDGHFDARWPDNNKDLQEKRKEQLLALKQKWELQARLVELDLLEQALNAQWQDLVKFKLLRLADISNRLDKLESDKEEPKDE